MTDPSDPRAPAAASLSPENATAPPVPNTTDPDQLPEYEELTPELVEDEAIRGDFVIRWATILLAVLMGWTQIDDTTLLVRIRSAFERPLPFGHDTFSASAAERSWADLAWLVNPILALAYKSLGGVGLTILGALTSGLTFWILSRVSVRGVSTWWGSVCAAIALVATFPHLTPGPASISLLGTALLLFQLHRWSEDRTGAFSWKIPLLLWGWSQLDPLAWVGPAILLLFTLSWIGLRGTEPGDDPGRSRKLWKLTGIGLLAWLIHPMHYHVLLSPFTAFFQEYPELREYYRVSGQAFVWQWFPVFSAEFGRTADLFAYTALFSCGVALLTFAINFKRLTWEWLLPWAGILALAALCADLLPLAGLLSCALATLNAQVWYRASCSQEYTVDSLPLFWNRGGRAITVVGLLLLGLVASNGMLMGREGRRIGAGFSPQMAANIAGAEKLSQRVASKEVFNFRLEQGDLLIWAGLKPYVDRRLTLYTQGGENLLIKHRKLRLALRPKNSKDPEMGQTEFWKTEFDKLHLNQVIPRLSEPNPDYQTMVLLLSQGWVMSNLESFGAVLSRPDSPDESFQKYLKEHPGENYIEKTFRSEPSKEDGMNLPWLFPRRPTVYDKWLWQPQPLTSESVQLARHEEKLVELLVGGGGGNNPNTFLTATALALSAFRHARAAITTDPQSIVGYQSLARASQYMLQVELNISQTYGIPYQPEFWMFHAIHAHHHALQLNPDLAEDHERLAFLQLDRGKLDLALTHLQQVYRITGQYLTLSKENPGYKEEAKRRTQIVKELKEHIKKTNEAIGKIAGIQGKWEEQVQTALQQQCPGLALEIMEKHRTDVAKSVTYQTLQVGLLMDVGRTEDALTQARSLEGVIPQSSAEIGQPMATEIRMLHAFAGLSVGDNTQSEKTIEAESRIVAERAIQDVLTQVPMSTAVGLQFDLFVASQSLVTDRAVNQSGNRWAYLQLMLAQSELSTGRNQAARDRMKRVLAAESEAYVRPLLAYYLQLLTNEEIPVFSEAQQAAIRKAQENAAPPTIGPAPAPGAPIGPAPAIPPTVPAGNAQPGDTPPPAGPATPQ